MGVEHGAADEEDVNDDRHDGGEHRGPNVLRLREDGRITRLNFPRPDKYIPGEKPHLPRRAVRARGVVVQLLASEHQVLMMKRGEHIIHAGLHGVGQRKSNFLL